MNSSQEVPESQSVANDTPTTTPPAPVSNPGTPAPAPEPEISNAEPMDVDEQQEEEEDGSISLPLSKIKRIFKMDTEYLGASQAAVFATGAATELFIQYLTEQASFLAKMDKRKKILYKDFSTAVSSQDSLNFLSDTVPKTVPLRDVLKEPATNTAPADPVEQPEAAKAEPRRIDITSMLPVSSDAPPPPRKANINDLMSN